MVSFMTTRGATQGAGFSRAVDPTPQPCGLDCLTPVSFVPVPDPSPIDLLSKAAARIIETVCAAIGEILGILKAQEYASISETRDT